MARHREGTTLDELTIGIAVLVVAAIALLFAFPPALVSLKQLFSKKPAEPAPDDSLPDSPALPPAKTKSKPTDKFQLENLPTPHSSDFTGRTSENALLTGESNEREKRKFFISYTSKDSAKAQWIGWTLKDLGHEAFVHEWEVGPGQSIADWMERRLKESNHLIGVFSPDYIDAEYSKSERLAGYWKDAIGRKGFLMPILIYPCELPMLVQPLRWLDLTDCGRDQARSKLRSFITPPTAPKYEPPFEEVVTGGHATASEPAYKPRDSDHV